MIKEAARELLKNALQSLGIKAEITFDYPPSIEMGHYATNVALKAAKSLGKNPREAAEAIIRAIPEKEKGDFSFSVAGPGFINIKVASALLHKELARIIEKKEKFLSFHKKKRKTILEFVSANPTGPLTLAAGRGGFYGDVLANILALTGEKAYREYYINDAGNQIRTLGFSVRASLGLIPDAEEYYRGAYIVDWAKGHRAEIEGRLSRPPEKEGSLFADYILKRYIVPALGERGMKVHFDKWFSEAKGIRAKHLVEKMRDLLVKKGVTYEKEGALWLKTSAHGDDKDRVIITSEGLPTYFLVDISYHYDKFERGFDRAIDILGADHHGYVPRLQAAMALLGHAGKLEIIITQFVRLLKDGREMKMSKRLGTYVAMDDLLAEVGHDAARFFFLMRSVDTHMDFDADLAKERSKKNAVFYVKYAHARIASILKKAKGKAKINPKKINYALLEHPTELELLCELMRFPEVIEAIADDYQVLRLPNYAISLADAFHRFYEQSRVITDNHDLTKARIALLLGTQIVLRKALDIMNIDAPQKM